MAVQWQQSGERLSRIQVGSAPGDAIWPAARSSGGKIPWSPPFNVTRSVKRTFAPTAAWILTSPTARRTCPGAEPVRERRPTRITWTASATPGNTPIPGECNPTCTGAASGPCGSIPATPPPPKPTVASVTCWSRARPGCRWPSTCRPRCCGNWPASSCSSSTSWASCLCPPPARNSSSRSSVSAMSGAPSWSPPTCPLTNGLTCSVLSASPGRCWTASPTTSTSWR